MKRFYLRLLLPILGLLAAAPASAAVPDPAQCIVPDLLTLVGRNGQGAVDPGHPFTVALRGFAGDPFAGGSVILDFSNCPDLRICTDQGDPNILVDCLGHSVRGISDNNGELTFRVVGSAVNIGASPGSTGPSLDVYADGVFLRKVRVAALDQVGNDGLDPNDHASWLADFFSGVPYARSDYDGDGDLDPNDLSRWLATFFSGSSALPGGAPNCP